MNTIKKSPGVDLIPIWGPKLLFKLFLKLKLRFETYRKNKVKQLENIKFWNNFDRLRTEGPVETSVEAVNETTTQN